MKKTYYFGLTVFYVGIILFFVKVFKPGYFESINDIFIDLMWPIGLLIYAISKKQMDKKDKANSKK